ncbi:MAG: DNA translocase FtsK [Burkholderiaceae bacterium]
MQHPAKLDPLFETAKQLVIDTKNPSITNLLRHMNVGFNRAENLIKAMEGEIITPHHRTGRWTMLHGETYDTRRNPYWDGCSGWIWRDNEIPLAYAHIAVRCFSKRGREKARNEDAIMLPGLYRQGTVRIHGYLDGSEAHYFAIADGVSSSAVPSWASVRLLSLLRRLLTEAQTDASISELLHHLQKKYATDNDRPEHFGMASTLVGARLMGNTATIFNVGDSRAYLLTDGANGCQAQLLSRDHNLLNDMLDDGDITPDEAKNAASIYRGLTSQFINDPAYDELQVNVVTHTLQNGERLLLCSDGLNEVLSDADIGELFAENSDETLLKAYIATRSAGGVDDFSVIVIEAINFDVNLAPI